MHILLTGSQGMLGHAFITLLSSNYRVSGYDLPELDITNLTTIKSNVLKIKPDIIINTAAYTDVDGCETDSDLAYSVNGLGPRNLAIVSNELNIPLVHFSTDYIFDGIGNSPYKEWDLPNPQSVYGKSKLLGEQYVRQLTNKYYIIRTSWLYGQYGKNFVKTMLRLAQEREELGVVNDQQGSPTYTGDLAIAVSRLIQTQAYGTYHLTNRGSCTWYEFALEIFKQAGVNGIQVNPITTEELNRPAPRPKYSVMDNYIWRLQGFKPLRNYTEALREYLAAEDSKK